MFRLLWIQENNEHGVVVSYTAAFAKLTDAGALSAKSAYLTLPAGEVVVAKRGDDVVSLDGLSVGKEYDLNFNPSKIDQTETPPKTDG